MSDVFLSYASEDRARAAAIARGLEAQGWSVWWDRNIPAGERFAEVIEKEIRGARCIVVLWSSVSVKKDWVRDEAAEGQSRGILVPVFVEPLPPPLGFRQIQAADLSDWHDDPAEAGFQALCRDIAAILDPASRRPTPIGTRLHELASLISVHDPAGSRRRLREFKAVALCSASDDARLQAVDILKSRLGFVAAEESAPMAVRRMRQEIFEGIKALAPAALGACLADGELEGIDLYGFDFSGADLHNVSFRGAFLVEADFLEAKLDEANLTRCYVRNARFSRASLAGTNLTDVDWFNAVGLTAEQLAAARRDTVQACPRDEGMIEAYLRSKYGFPMESWEPRLQEQLRSAWREYLAPGGLCSVIPRLDRV